MSRPGPDARGLVLGADGRWRCAWGAEPALYRAYHDDEWGVPVRDDHRLFEKLVLEGFQSGLSWLTVLRKRPAFREVFRGFDPAVVAAFGPDDVGRLLADGRIIRHRGKIEAAVHNAGLALELIAEHGSLADHLWRFAPATHPAPARLAAVPTTSPEATALARDLKRRGWRFVGPTTAYAFLQAMGLVDDHVVGCHARRAA